MPEKRKRGHNFTAEDKDKLIKLLATQRETILNKKTDGSANEAKQKSWNHVTNSFNLTATIPRNKDSLIKLWEKMKTESKIYYQKNKRYTNDTGGELADIKVCPIMEQVCALLGRGCTEVGGQDFDTSMSVEECSQHQLSGVVPTEIPINQNDIIEDATTNFNADEDCTKEIKLEIPVEISTAKIPLWSRHRPMKDISSKRRTQICNSNDGNENVSSFLTSFTSVNKKKEDIEDLKRQLLQEEIEFKRKLYQLQLEAAVKEVEIKTEMLNQMKDGAINLANLLASQKQ